MKETLVIGLGHKSKHGKDTAAKAIVDARGSQFDIRLYAFAHELKREVTETVQSMMQKDNVTVETATRLLCERADEDCIKRGIKGADGNDFRVSYEEKPDMNDPYCPFGKQRTLLQWWGTDYRRHQDPYYWVKRLARRVQDEQPKVAVITDVRFPNEFFWVESLGGITVKVSRHGYTNPEADKHESEHALDNFTFAYEINVLDGEIEQLKKDAVTVFDMIRASFEPVDNDFTVAGMTPQEEAAANGQTNSSL